MGKNNGLFLGLVYSLQTQALILLGQVRNPATGKKERDFELAKVNIEVLEELMKKTQGNLTKEEESVTVRIINELNTYYQDGQNGQIDGIDQNNIIYS